MSKQIDEGVWLRYSDNVTTCLLIDGLPSKWQDVYIILPDADPQSEDAIVIPKTSGILSPGYLDFELLTLI